MVTLSMAYLLHRAKMGERKGMPDVLRVLAKRLREGTLDVAEVEFIAAALEQIAAASNPAKEAPKAFLLVGQHGGRGRTKADRVTLEIDRAFRVRDLVDSGMSAFQAFEEVAAEEGIDDTKGIREAYHKYLEVLWLGSPEA